MKIKSIILLNLGDEQNSASSSRGQKEDCKEKISRDKDQQKQLQED